MSLLSHLGVMQTRLDPAVAFRLYMRFLLFSVVCLMHGVVAVQYPAVNMQCAVHVEHAVLCTH